MIAANGYAYGILVREGSSDNGLSRILESALLNFGFTECHIESIEQKGTVEQLLLQAFNLYPDADIIFVHRDADNAGYDKRLQEVDDAAVILNSKQRFNSEIVPVIPVTETESWIIYALTDEQFRSDMNYSGVASIPKRSDVERISDAKERLEDIVRDRFRIIFSNRRRRDYSFNEERKRILESISETNVMEGCNSFNQFLEKTRSILHVVD